MPQNWFFDAWSALGRIVVVGALAYLAVVLMLRMAGNRTLAKSAAFDHVVTVALGSTLATTLLSKQTTLAGGITAFFALIALQYAIAILVLRSRTLQQLLIHAPTVVVHDGQLCRAAMRRARVTEDDVHAALRKSGVGRVDAAALVVLESDGKFSVVRRSDRPIDVLGGLRDQVTA